MKKENRKEISEDISIIEDDRDESQLIGRKAAEYNRKNVVRHRKRAMFTAVGIHEIADVILAADINANIKFVLIHISTSLHRDLRSTGIQLPMILWHHQPRLSESTLGRSDAMIRTACKNGWNTSRINSLRVSS